MRVLHIAWGFRPWRGGGLIGYTEDLMAVQRAHGYEVAYFCAARRSPVSQRPRLNKWIKNGVQMYEVLNSPIFHSGDDGPFQPELDLREEHSERFFAAALTEFKPDLIQIQELVGQPFSLIELAHARNIPVVHTLHDYYPLCPTVKLYDKEGAFCTGGQVGAKCAACCADAKKPDAFNRLGATLWYVSHRPGPRAVQTTARLAHKTMKQVGWLPMRVARYMAARKATSNNGAAQPTTNGRAAEIFQRRRDTNIALLNQVDLLVAQSTRQAEIYRSLGVEAHKLVVVPSTQKHIEHLQPKRMDRISTPINFATLNGCNTTQKGAHLMVAALRRLHELGLGDRFKLYVMGYVAEDIEAELTSYKNVVCRGTYSLRELESLLANVHVGIVPSVWEESYGIVGIELLARGIPVIGNNLGGIVDYTIDGVTGWVNRTNTAEGLARIMADIITGPEQIVRLNHSILERHTRIAKSMRTHFDEMAAVYERVLAVRRPRSMTQARLANESAA